MKARTSSRRSARRGWGFTGSRKKRIRWAFRLFIISFIMFFVLSLLFYPSYMTMRLGSRGIPIPYIYSAFGLVAINIAMYLFYFVLGVWIAGWALLWGKRESRRPRHIVVGSWMVPLSLSYPWISLAVMLVAGIPRQVMTPIAFVPPMLVAVVVPQLFVLGLLDRLGKRLSRAALGMGIFLVGMWGAGTAIGTEVIQPILEILLPVYLGLLVVEYLGVHLRINGLRF